MQLVKRDECIWFSHLPVHLRRQLTILEPGDRVAVLIDGRETVWQRMRAGRDGRATDGLTVQKGSQTWAGIKIGTSMDVEFVLKGSASQLSTSSSAIRSTEPPPGENVTELHALIREAKRIAVRYRELTLRPLGITGEVAEVEAARLMGAELCPAREAGCDAIKIGSGGRKRIQIKGRVILPGSKRGQRIGQIKLAHEWDVVWFVTLDEKFEPVSIHEADRASVEAALKKPGSKSRNVRGTLGIRQFLRISEQVWP